MKLLPFSVRESFDRSNPMVRRLLGISRSKRDRGMLLLYILAGLLVLATAAIWGVGISRRDRGTVVLAGNITYGLLVTFAFIAPSLGAAARRRMDCDPCLEEAFATPIPERSYLAPVHGSILIQTIVAALIHGITAGAIFGAVLFPDSSISNALNTESLIRLFLRAMDFDRITGMEQGHDIALISVLIVVMTVCYASGVYLHATMLAAICQRRPQANFDGGVLTGVIIAFMMVLWALRIVILRFYLSSLTGWPGQDPTGLIVYFILIESLMTIARFMLARHFWRLIGKNALAETRGYLVGT